MFFKKALYTSTAVLGLLVGAAPALAQTRDGGVRLEEVIVTAERRSENLQKTPLAVTALTAESLQQSGTNGISQLTDAMPNLKFNAAPDFPQIYLRGVGNNDLSTNGSPGVALATDGVFVTRPVFGDGGFFDVERVEVLRGPQGTLYGRNSIGGVINILTRKPVYDFNGSGSVEVGNYNLVRATGVVNIPLMQDSLALRAAFQTTHRDGYYSNGLNDANDVSVRVKLLWEPIDRLSILATLDHFATNGKGTLSRSFPYTGDPWETTFDGSESKNDLHRTTFHVQADLGLGFANFTYLGAVSELRQLMILEAQDLARPIPPVSSCPANPLCTGDYRQEDDAGSFQVSHELRLSSLPGQRLAWVLGFYYLDDDRDSISAQYEGRLDSPALRGNRAGSAHPYFDTLSLAGFAQATLSVTDRLRITAGIRYTKEEKDDLAIRLANGRTTVNYGEWDATNWRLGFDYDLTPTSMIYANATTGYKAGGFFAVLLPPDNTFQEENVKAYSFGTKNRFLDNALQVNAEAFYYDYTDYQSTAFVRGPLGTLTQTFNAGKATIYGAEVEISYLMTERDRFDLAVTYLNTEFDDFRVPYSAAAPCATRVDCITDPKSATGFSLSYTGRELPQSPEWTASFTYAHTFTLPNEGHLTGRFNASYSADYTRTYETTIPASAQFQDGYTKINLSAIYDDPRDRFTVTGWLRNATDEVVGELLQTGTSSPYRLGLQAPRTYGVTVAARF